jgi:glycosyltransferase involved in cell wall biosynthesis
MHDILWQAYARGVDSRRLLPPWLWRWLIGRYRRAEERAWTAFDRLIAINHAEQTYVRRALPDAPEVFYAPMGTDLRRWPYSWQPGEPRLAYYGGLGTPHNQRAALRCAREIMPAVWRHAPQTELWLVGSNPPESLRALTADPRIKVTGFVEEVQEVLRTMTAVLCPWTGKYGFRSRLIEVMALGVPVIASADAVYGMDLTEGEGLFLSDDAHGFAKRALALLNDPAFAADQSRLARAQVQDCYSYEGTYVTLMDDLTAWLTPAREGVPCA